MCKTIPLKNSYCSFKIKAQKKCCKHHHYRCKSCRYKITDIIHFRRKKTDMYQFVISIGNHRIKRIYCLIGKAERRASKRDKQHRSNYPICRIFGDRLHIRFCHFTLVKILRITPYQIGYFLSCTEQVPFF